MPHRRTSSPRVEVSARAETGRLTLGPGLRDRRGFTLLEILMALALIALLAGVLVQGTTNLLAEGPQTPNEVLLKAISESRRHAVENDCEVALSYSKDNRLFTLTAYKGGAGTVAASFPVAGEGDFGFDFLVARKGNAVLIGGVLVETATVPSVSFYPDGTCTPFRAQITGGDAPEVIAIDPWTCAPILEKKTAQP